MLPALSGAISCQEVGRAEEGVSTGHRAAAGPAWSPWGPGSDCPSPGSQEQAHGEVRGQLLQALLLGWVNWGSEGPRDSRPGQRDKAPPTPHRSPTSPRTGGHHQGPGQGSGGSKPAGTGAAGARSPSQCQPTSTERRKSLPTKTTSPPTQSRASSRKPSILPAARALPQPPQLTTKLLLQVLFPGTLGGAWPLSTRLQRVREDSRAGAQGGCTFHPVTLAQPQRPQAMLPLADLWGQEAKATISRHLAANGSQVSCETPDGTLRSSGRPPGSQLCPHAASRSRAFGGRPRAPPTPRAQSCWKTTARPGRPPPPGIITGHFPGGG